MKKKFLIVLLCALSAIACMIGLSACNLLESSDDSGNSEHTHTIEHYEAKEATCLKDGMKEYWRCTSCGDYFSDANGENKVSYSSLKIKGEHKEVTDAGYAKTCTADGLTDGKHCSVCNEVIVAQQVIPAGHTEVIIQAIPKTCQYAGSTEGKKCSVCGTVTLKPQVVPAGHTIVTDEGKEATCTQTGLTDGEHCSECSYVKAQEVIPAKGHTEVTDSAVPATCTTDGKTEGKHCSECSAVLKAQTVIPANGHTEVIDAAVAASCTTAGKTEGKHCSVCSAVLVKQETIPASHNFGSDKLCTVCGAHAASEGLEYELREYHRDDFTGQGYGVKGIGTCTDADIVIPETHLGLPVVSVGDYSFKGCTIIKSVTVPDSVVYIIDTAFAESSLETIHIGKGVTEGCYFFRAYSLREITVDSANAKLTAVDGVLYSKDMKAIYCHPADKTETSFIMPSTVEYVDFGSFEYSAKLQTLSMPATVKSIGIRAFRGCENLLDFTWPTALKTIGAGAFEGCKKLTRANLPEGLTDLGHGVFWYCTNLTEVSFPDSLIDIASQPLYETAYYNNDANWEIKKDGEGNLEYKALYVGKHLVEVVMFKAHSYTVKDGTKSVAGYAIVNAEFNHDKVSEEYLNQFYVAVVVPDSVIFLHAFMFLGYGRNAGLIIDENSEWLGYFNDGIGDYVFSSESVKYDIQDTAFRSMLENFGGDWGYIKKIN